MIAFCSHCQPFLLHHAQSVLGVKKDSKKKVKNMIKKGQQGQDEEGQEGHDKHGLKQRHDKKDQGQDENQTKLTLT